MSETLEKAQDAIKDRIREIEEESGRLQRALKSLNGSTATRARRGRPAVRRSGGKRAPRGQRREQVISHLKSNPGARPAEIAKAIKASPNQVHGLIRKLRDEKLVRKSGKGYKLSAAKGAAS